MLALPVLGLLAFGLTRDTFILPSPLVGGPAPAFELESFSGDSLRLDELSGRVVVINFWASWCGPCRVEHPALRLIEQIYPPQDVLLIGIPYRDRRADSERFMAALGGDWPQLVDPSSTAAIDYGVYGPPETFFIGADGRVARKRIGPISWEFAKATIDSLVAARNANDGTAETSNEAQRQPPREAPAQ